jgi:hypothetical protein
LNPCGTWDFNRQKFSVKTNERRSFVFIEI